MEIRCVYEVFEVFDISRCTIPAGSIIRATTVLPVLRLSVFPTLDLIPFFSLPH